MKYWFFGVSSEYASYIIEDLESAGHEVIMDWQQHIEFMDNGWYYNKL
jgi:hypothetical protein